MKSALRELPHILDRIAKYGCVLMLDFDGTLSPIVTRPEDAKLSVDTRNMLERAAQRYPIAIISGRSLSDIRSRVGISDITYAGDHGYEWFLHGEAYSHAISPQLLTLLTQAQIKLVELQDVFSDLIIERKSISIALNYRSLDIDDQRAFRLRASEIAAPYVAQGHRVIDSALTFELLADSEWSKGKCAEVLLSELRRDSTVIPLYIGDSLTDEDVFETFTDGITIRVGESTTSAAKYYVAHRDDVDTLLAAIVQIPDRG